MEQSYKPLIKEEYESAEVGDEVVRMLGFCIPHKLKITGITSGTIICGAYEFDKLNSLEIDSDILVPVSYISKIIKKDINEKS